MARTRHKSDYNFIAYSDIMTGLAIIFLFIANYFISIELIPQLELKIKRRFVSGIKC